MSVKPKLLEQLRDKIRMKHYSIRTEKAYVGWNLRYIFFHNKRHPKEMGAREIEQFLSHLAVQKNVAASTQNQALSAILFLYKEVLGINVSWLEDVTRAKRPEKLPVVFTRDEARSVMAHLDGIPWLLACLFYGAGLRLMEGVRLQIKDIDFGYKQIVVRDGKGEKDRVTMLPKVVEIPLQKQSRKNSEIYKT